MPDANATGRPKTNIPKTMPARAHAMRLGLWSLPSLWPAGTGAVVDEAALYDALSGGRLAGAALDVFEAEPYRPAAAEKDLRTLASVVLTPHVGSNTAEANWRMAQACLENLARFFAGSWEQLSRVDLP